MWEVAYAAAGGVEDDTLVSVVDAETLPSEEDTDASDVEASASDEETATLADAVDVDGVPCAVATVLEICAPKMLRTSVSASPVSLLKKSTKRCSNAWMSETKLMMASRLGVVATRQ